MQVPWCGDMGQSSLVIEVGFIKKIFVNPVKGLYKDNKVSYSTPIIVTRWKISKKHSQNLDRELGDEGPYIGTLGSIRNIVRCDNLPETKPRE